MEIENNIVELKYYKQKVEETIALCPQDLRDTKQQIKKLLNQKLFKYNTDLNGIICNLKGIKQKDDKAIIYDEQADIFLPVVYKATIFKPEKGDILPGTITQIYQSHIGLLCFNIFNVVINFPDINQKIFQQSKDGNWTDLKSGENLEVGNELQFQIKSIRIDQNGDFQFVGSIQNSKLCGLTQNIKQKYTVQENEQLIEDITTNMENNLV
ncbi:hypothetical protein PPERSA_00275 [Pseudocohnilembus persalinus]|uniref:RPA43 OB domain-containing protein n=1 Tax=Pseudocohnilembus persalinus TaxID=266149 RepID=A0A0V0Q969_PSEPJ|nr:hypothetical protein PPERSA_00275 [Pseudocohnilembus persalinus]|eukprot:KRW98687.1 hypothetical protein PPERSA_00275 [Pseudocohnilembus persalinus]